MSFNVKEFKDAVGEPARPCLFKVIIDGDEKLGFFIKDGQLEQDKLFFTVMEMEDFYTSEKLFELREKLNSSYTDAPTVELQRFRRVGGVPFVIKGKVWGMKFNTAFDWASPDALTEWSVELDVTWDTPKKEDNV
jgi:hypothetical protein